MHPATLDQKKHTGLKVDDGGVDLDVTKLYFVLKTITYQYVLLEGRYSFEPYHHAVSKLLVLAKLVLTEV